MANNVRETVKLSKRTVDAAKAPATGEAIIWDSQVPLFGLRIYHTGRRNFIYQYRPPESRTSRRMILGQYPEVTTEQARALAVTAAARLAAGEDPQGDSVDALRRRTLADVFPDYLAERRGKIAPRTITEYERMWTTLLAPTFGKLRVSALTESSVASWHAARRSTPIAANRAVDLVSSFCTWASRRGYRPKHSNPCEGVERYEEVRRGRSLSVEEYQRLGAAFEQARTAGIRPAPKLRKRTKNAAKQKHRPKTADLPRTSNPVILDALRFLALSGWREQEALTLRWDAVDLARGVAVLSDTKSGRSERALGEPALDVLRAQARVDGNPFVFVGTPDNRAFGRQDTVEAERPGKHIVEMKYTWASIKQVAKLEETAPFRLHDLRHSFTTIARDELGLGDHVIARLVGHTLSGQTSRYGEVRDATVRTAANNIAATIEKYLTSTETKVLPFSAKHRSA